MEIKTFFGVLIYFTLNISCVTTYSQRGTEKIKVCRLSKQLKIESDSLEVRKYMIVGKLKGMTFGIIDNSNATNDSIVFNRNFLLFNKKRYLSDREWKSFDPICNGMIGTDKSRIPKCGTPLPHPLRASRKASEKSVSKFTTQ
ncbi:MAG: hypothetical protein KIH03_06460 [Paludibacteraceae bacterium]|nr:hypothetical protein [Paludibacteraceae bacterium]